MQNYINSGKTIVFTATNDVVGGDLVTVGSIVGVAVSDIPAGEEGILETEGVFELPPAESAAIAQGAVVYVTTQGKIASSEAGNTRAGIAWAARTMGESVVRVKINV